MFRNLGAKLVFSHVKVASNVLAPKDVVEPKMVEKHWRWWTGWWPIYLSNNNAFWLFSCCLFVCLCCLLLCLFVCLFVCSHVCLFASLSDCTVFLFAWLFIWCLFVCLRICLIVLCLFLYLCFCLFVYLYLFVCLFICLEYLLICLFVWKFFEHFAEIMHFLYFPFPSRKSFRSQSVSRIFWKLQLQKAHLVFSKGMFFSSQTD